MITASSSPSWQPQHPNTDAAAAPGARPSHREGAYRRYCAPGIESNSAIDTCSESVPFIVTLDRDMKCAGVRGGGGEGEVVWAFPLFDVRWIDWNLHGGAG